jgi:bifunctional pyridoxal-dependent enzyme with beta-cystathionase and maltose regulon repressor activities
MPPPNSENSFLGIEAKYKDLDQWFSTIPAAISQSKQYVQATLKTQYPEVPLYQGFLGDETSAHIIED